MSARNSGHQGATRGAWESDTRGIRARHAGGGERMMGFMSEPDEQQIIVVGPDGRPVHATVPGNSDDQRGMEVAEQVEQPAKVMRIGSMIKQLLEEVRAAPLDEASRNRLREIHETSIRELEQGLAPELRDELERLTLPFGEDTTPSDAELRIAQAQLV